MRTIGWVICFASSLLAYVTWLTRCPQLDNLFKSIPDSFGMEFLGLLLGVVIIGGGAILIAVIWYLIWRPEF